MQEQPHDLSLFIRIRYPGLRILVATKHVQHPLRSPSEVGSSSNVFTADLTTTFLTHVRSSNFSCSWYTSCTTDGSSTLWAIKECNCTLTFTLLWAQEERCMATSLANSARYRSLHWKSLDLVNIVTIIHVSACSLLSNCKSETALTVHEFRGSSLLMTLFSSISIVEWNCSVILVESKKQNSVPALTKSQKVDFLYCSQRKPLVKKWRFNDPVPNNYIERTERYKYQLIVSF